MAAEMNWNNEATPDQIELIIAWHLCKLFSSLVWVVIYHFIITIFVVPGSFPARGNNQAVNIWADGTFQ